MLDGGKTESLPLVRQVTYTLTNVCGEGRRGGAALTVSLN